MSDRFGHVVIFGWTLGRKTEEKLKDLRLGYISIHGINCLHC